MFSPDGILTDRAFVSYLSWDSPKISIAGFWARRRTNTHVVGPLPFFSLGWRVLNTHLGSIS